MEQAHSDILPLDSSAFPPQDLYSVQRNVGARVSAKRDHSAGDEINYAGLPEAQLLTLAQSDHTAFVELSNRYVDAIYGRILRMVQNPEDAEDVVQDALLHAYRHLPEFRRTCRFSTWLTSIAINTALMLLRKRKSRPETSLEHSDDVGETWRIREIVDPGEDAECILARQQTHEVVSRALERLRPFHRRALDLYYFQHQSVEEVAHSLGISKGAAKSRLCRARLTVRELLEGQQFPLESLCY